MVLCARRDVEPDLPHDGHVQVVDEGDLQTLGALVEELVVEALDVKQHRVAVVLAGLGTLKCQEKSLDP